MGNEVSAVAGEEQSVEGTPEARRRDPTPLPDDCITLAHNLKPTGVLLTPGAQEYEVARTWQAWNNMSSGIPSGIVLATAPADVQAAIIYAAQHNLDLCVTVARQSQYCMNDNALVLDMSRMTECTVDATRKTATVQAGTRWGDLDGKCEAVKLATTGAMDPNASVIGTALHGGHGFLERMFGLVSDNVMSAEVVLADGQVVIASPGLNEDLYWGIRGGGGNLGVVVSMTLSLFELPNDGDLFGHVLTHRISWTTPSRLTLLERYLDAAKEASDPLALCVTLHGQGTVREAAVWINDDFEIAERYLPPKPAFLEEILGGFAVPPPVETINYWSDLQRLGPLLGEDGTGLDPGNYFVQRVLCRARMAEVALDIAIAAEHSPNTSSFVTIQLLGGAAAEPHANATAVAHRHARHLVTIVGKWNAHHEKHPVCAWVGELYHQLCIHSMDGVHEPVLPAPLHQPSTHKPEDGEQEPVFVSSFGCNHDDLVDLKRKYDPGNVFHMNDNIDPNPQPAF